MRVRRRPFDILLDRLRRDHGLYLPEGLILQRVYAGYWQRSAGAWSWVAVDEEQREYIAGFSPVNKLARAKKLIVTLHPRYVIPEVDIAA